MLYVFDMTLGKRIARARKRLRMTQRELGRFLGVSYQAVSQWECDKTVPDTRKVDELAHVLRVTTDALLSGRDAA